MRYCRRIIVIACGRQSRQALPWVCISRFFFLVKGHQVRILPTFCLFTTFQDFISFLYDLQKFDRLFLWSFQLVWAHNMDIFCGKCNSFFERHLNGKFHFSRQRLGRKRSHIAAVFSRVKRSVVRLLPISFWSTFPLFANFGVQFRKFWLLEVVLQTCWIVQNLLIISAIFLFTAPWSVVVICLTICISGVILWVLVVIYILLLWLISLVWLLVCWIEIW